MAKKLEVTWTLQEMITLAVFCNEMMAHTYNIISNVNEYGEYNDGEYDKGNVHHLHEKFDSVYQTYRDYLRQYLSGKNDQDYDRFFYFLMNLLHTANQELPVYLVEYHYDYAYGGPEEGGWYYDHLILFNKHKCKDFKQAEIEADRLIDEHVREYKYNYQQNRRWHVEVFPGRHETKHRPHYC